LLEAPKTAMPFDIGREETMSASNAKTDDYPILSHPFESMKLEYDVVVVGSGYGAGVAASRMARAGKSVAVLELGWERRCVLLQFYSILLSLLI
jgi:NADPH-dependent 2,4-dienoyl-CoA reductase/sulfur reductase-like enzyme